MVEGVWDFFGVLLLLILRSLTLEEFRGLLSFRGFESPAPLISLMEIAQGIPGSSIGMSGDVTVLERVLEHVRASGYSV